MGRCRLGELRAEGRGPDLIAITGDLAFSGQAAEYKLVEAWLTEALLPAAGVGADRLLIVPGNHDVDRSACRSETIMALEARLREGDSARIAAVLSDPPQRKLVHQRYKHYLAFLKRVGVAHPIAPSWSWRTEVRGTGLHIAGLDTAWLASEEHVQGRLALGLSVVNAHIPTPGQWDRDIVIALTHHPLSWLVQRDQSEVRAPLLARAHLHLRGHLHEADYSYTQSPQHRLIELPAGATYAGHGWPMSFQLIELDGAAGQGRVSLRAWQRDWDAWVSDRTKLPPDGDWTFPLRWAP